MFFRRFKEKELKMIWQVRKNNRISYLAGTAHFFPYSFRSALKRYLKDARTVIFEGPLDQDSMAKVVEAGIDSDNNYHLFTELDRQTIDGITQALRPACRDPNSFFILDLCKLKMENPVYDMIKGMKPWLAFFTLWSSYLKKNGWKYSVDMEGYRTARELKKNMVYLETIEEQIKVLENLSLEKIIYFLEQVDRWPVFAQEYVEYYLAGDLENLRSRGLRFPSRHHTVIDHRDEIFYERMHDYVEQGNAVIFVGAPHVSGISKLLRTDGYRISRPDMT